MRPLSGTHHPTHFSDLAVTVDFHCQSACRFCVVREGMNHYRGVPLSRFRQIAEDNRQSGKYRRVIFTGGEVTLEASLFDFLQVARQSGSFEHVRLQTNARRLADPAFARRLVDAGVDELFVSLHGPSAEVHDHITQRPGSFDEAVRALQNLSAMPVTVWSNTVLNRDNAESLPAMPPLLHGLGVRRMELWGYLPMERTEEARRLIAPMSQLAPPLLACLRRAEELGLPVTTKYLPRCLLGRFGHTLDNAQPDVVIVESFWDRFPAFACLYEALCEHGGGSCLGLSHPYVHEHGWERERLSPTPRTTAWVDPRQRAAPGDGQGEATPLGGAWAELVAQVPEATPGRLARAWLTRNEARYRYELDGGASVELVLAARDESQPALVRTRSFNVFYTRLDARGREDELRARIRAVVQSVRARDDGSLSLDPRKGLARDHVRPKRRLPVSR